MNALPDRLFGVPAGRLSHAPVVISSQRANRRLTTTVTRLLLRITDRMVDAIVVNCDAMRRHLIDEERVPASLVHVCRNGIDTALFRPDGSGSLGGIVRAPSMRACSRRAAQSVARR
jgi:hypothetical protein